MSTPTRDFTVHCLSEAVSPITHAKGVSGNESLVNREPVTTRRGVQWVPVLSGNAIRHCLVREPGVRWLIGVLGLAGGLGLPQLNYLMHGGNLTEGGGRENVRAIADMQRLFPLLRLLGGCLPGQIVPGSLLVWRGTLVCEENRSALETMTPSGWMIPDRPLRPAEAFVSAYQYTRGDVSRQGVDLLPDDLDGSIDGDSKSILMPFSGQAVMRGSLFLHGFVLQHCSLLELGALLWSLRLWQAAGGTIGSSRARGHGRLSLRAYVKDVGEDAVVAYHAHVAANRDECVAWIQEVFRKRNESEGKPKRGKTRTATQEGSTDG